MTGQPPSPGSDRRDPLGFDEIVALLVAFTVVGAVLWWSLGRRAEDWLSQQWSTPGITGTQPDSDRFEIDSTEPQVETTPVDPDSARISPNPEATSPAPTPLQTGRTGIPRAVIIPGTVAPAVVPTTRPVSPAQPDTSAAVPEEGPATAPTIVVPGVSPDAPVSFADVPADYWAYPFISELSRRGIISGFTDNRFQPDQSVTRTEYAALVSEVLPDATQGQIAFGDVPAGFWGTQAIDEAVKSGFLKGFPNETFQPNQPISRLQVMLSLVNGFQLPKPADPNLPLQAFDDREQIPAWARPAVAAATDANVVVNYPNVSLLNSEQPATRAEVAAMLYQALTTTGQLPPIQSNYIVRP